MRIPNLLTLVVTLTLVGLSSTAMAADVVDHGPLTELLGKYVDGSGQVAYAKWHASNADREALDAYLDEIASAKLDGASRDARLAFYINAYNANVIDAVLDRWPVESVMKEEGFFKKVPHRVAGEQMTLDELEHKTIRPSFAEPRVHFVLVCAAKSCPRLRQKALTEKTLEADLEAATREFVPKATALKDGKLRTSQLFNWFADDFEAAEGSVAAYLAKYLEGAEQKAAQSGAKVVFGEYDWAINAQ